MLKMFMSEDEKFVRKYCKFVTTYSLDEFSVYGMKSSKVNAGVVISGRGSLREAAFTNAKKELVEHLAYIETLQSAIDEVRHSVIEYKYFIASILEKKLAKAIKGLNLEGQ